VACIIPIYWMKYVLWVTQIHITLSVQDRDKFVCCGHGGGPLGSMSGMEFVHHVGDYWLHRRDSALWRVLVPSSSEGEGSDLLAGTQTSHKAASVSNGHISQLCTGADFL
jgi:hypothetical protein